MGSKKHTLGVLRTVGHVLNERVMRCDDERALRGAVRWFNQNLTAPRKLRRSRRSSGSDLIDTFEVDAIASYHDAT